MPLYFAYGSNMNKASIRSRCQDARFVGVARLPRHRFALMSNGYATVRHDPIGDAHGALYELAPAAVAPLDRYEDVAGGLYLKAAIGVRTADGSACRALIYLGADAATGPSIHPGYMEDIVATARALGLPGAYVRALEALLMPALAL